MTSFQIALSPNRRAAARFVGSVRRKLQRAYALTGVNQSEIADKLGVHRSVISRQLRGQADLSLSRLGEIAWALGFEPQLELLAREVDATTNHGAPRPVVDVRMPAERRIDPPYIQLKRPAAASARSSSEAELVS